MAVDAAYGLLSRIEGVCIDSIEETEEGDSLAASYVKGGVMLREIRHEAEELSMLLELFELPLAKLSGSLELLDACIYDVSG